MPPRPRLALALLLLAACRPGGDAPAAVAGGGSYLYVFAGIDAHRHGEGAPAPADSAAAHAPAGASDLLAVIDADSLSPTYAQVVATAPVGASGTFPHHTELEMPAGGRALFANSYGAGRVYRFDLADPRRPRVAGTADSVPGLRTPHSFVRLADGNVVATMQFGDRRAKGDPGGLALLDPEGRVVRTSSAADPAHVDPPVRTYSLDVAEAGDRVLTTSSPMDAERTAHVVQLWRLSDLALLKTIPVPPIAGDTTWHYPFEVRFLPDGKSALLNTYYCGFYHLTGLDGDAPAIARVLALDDPRQRGCSVPLLVGRWWIMPVGRSREFLVLDVADPRRPRVASRLASDSSFTPHWVAREPGTGRLVATSEGPDPRVSLLHFDSTSGRLSWDERFRERPGGPRGVGFADRAWPGGARVTARPHGAVFSRPAAR